MLDPQVIEEAEKTFAGAERNSALVELSSITLKHVMAESEHNLRNTHLAVLHLASGDLEKLGFYVQRAKIDFRDVIMWVMQEEE